jgi:hypothetical protein
MVYLTSPPSSLRFLKSTVYGTGDSNSQHNVMEIFFNFHKKFQKRIEMIVA